MTVAKAPGECAYGIWNKWVDEWGASPYNSRVFGPAPPLQDLASFVELLGGRCGFPVSGASFGLGEE